jgi:RHS repeat-associated protein
VFGLELDSTCRTHWRFTYSYGELASGSCNNGNRLSGTNSGGNASGTFDAQDRMNTYGAASYTYGPSGDLRTKTAGGQTTTYSYDAFGNLMGTWLPDGRTIEYVVDALNRRVGKKVNGVLTEGYLYDGKLRPVAWLDGAGAVKATFVYGLHVNVPEYMTVIGGSTYRILTDHLGSPRLVVDTASGAVVQRMDYDSFGQVLLDSAPGFQPLGFAGGLYDRDTGLVRFGARDYDPAVGRWTNKDPIRFRGGLNLYVYVEDDPIDRRDPTGLWGLAVNLDIDIIAPFLSGGGGSAGFSLVYSSDFGFGFYPYRPTDKPSEGFSVGASVQVCGGPGKGPWSGKFDTWGGNAGPWGAGYYESAGAAPGEDPGYAGFYGSWGIGTPLGLYYSQTDYSPVAGK